MNGVCSYSPNSRHYNWSCFLFAPSHQGICSSLDNKKHLQETVGYLSKKILIRVGWSCFKLCVKRHGSLFFMKMLMALSVRRCKTWLTGCPTPSVRGSMVSIVTIVDNYHKNSQLLMIFKIVTVVTIVVSQLYFIKIGHSCQNWSKFLLMITIVTIIWKCSRL